MIDFVLRIADLNIGVSANFRTTADYCREYLTDQSPDFKVAVTENDIGFERKKSERQDLNDGIPIRKLSDEYLETLAVYRKIAETVPAFDTVLFHGSVLAVGNNAYCFTAKSGTGKSTHARLWREMLGDRVISVNDDKPLFRLKPDGAFAYGTPWNGKENLGNNISVPLKAICILERSPDNRINAITKKEALPALIRQCYYPSDITARIASLSLIDRLADSVRLYRLQCNMEPEAAQMAFRELHGE